MATPTVPGRMLVDLAKAYALSEFYPLLHPTLTQAVATLSEALLASGEYFHLRLTPAGLTAGGTAAPRSGHVDRFGMRLWEHGVGTVVVRHDIGSDSLSRFLSAVALPPRVARAARSTRARAKPSPISFMSAAVIGTCRASMFCSSQSAITCSSGIGSG